MGIHKLIKELKLEDFIVQKGHDKIFIGNNMVNDFITIYNSGKLDCNWMVKEGSKIYSPIYKTLSEMSVIKLRELIFSDDVFDKPLTVVYTERNGKVLKQYCTEFGYPNITTDGWLMYDNTHFKTRQEALKCSIVENIAGIRWSFSNLWYDIKSAMRRVPYPFLRVLYHLRAKILRGVI